MKKITYSLVATGLLVAGFGGGWVAASARSTQPTVVENTPQTGVEAAKLVDNSSGEGLTPEELYTQLSGLSGSRFDAQYLAYVILMRNNLTGMDRLAKEKADNPDIKAKAGELWQSDTATMNELYNLQRSTGYAHH